MKKILLAVAVILIVIQFIPVTRDNPVSDPAHEIVVSADIRQILNNSCYDCHSNKTNWPFYSYVAPVSWLVTNHVKEGRKHLNFSEWANYSAKKQGKKVEEILEETAEGNMPLSSYLVGHPNAGLSSQDIDLLKMWVNANKDLQNPQESFPPEEHEEGNIE